MRTKLSVQLRDEAAAAKQYSERCADLTKTFRDGRVKFDGLRKTYTPIIEGGDQLPEETKALSTTTKQELDWFKPFFASAVNAALCKEATNQVAKADLVVFGKTFKDLPVAGLLNLEAKLKELLKVIAHIPVLDDTKNWKVGDQLTGSFQQDPPEWTYRTEKKPYNHIKAAATDKQPAQVEVMFSDVNVGKWTKMILSGGIPVSKKAALLAATQDAIKAVVKAREQANLVDVVETEDVGSQLFAAIVGVAV